MKSIFIIFCFVCLALAGAVESARSEAEYATQFNDFVRSYGRHYASLSERYQRYSIFRDNLDIIDTVNAENRGYTLGVGKFADWTFEEFKSEFLLNTPQNCSATGAKNKMSVNVNVNDLPTHVDWRDKGVVTPVKNQGSCGSCWAFSATGCIESAHAIKTGKLQVLSEQQLVDCAQDFNNHGCRGGLPSQAFEYIHYAGGMDTAECYPYEGQDGKCRFKKTCIGSTVIKSINITSGQEEEIVEALANNGPVSIAYQVVSDFMHYQSGVYSSNECHKDSEHVNHAVLDVGYGESNGVPYHIVKNSWGPDWGIDGYFWIHRGTNECGLATCAAYPKM